MKLWITALLAFALPASASAAAVKDTSYIVDRSRVLRDEVVVAAPIADVWTAFTTVDGWRTWATPYVTLSTPQLSVDAEFESSYNLDATPGDERNIHHRVLAYIPQRMFAFRTVRSPKGFPYPEEVRQVFSVVEFEALDGKRTRVKLSMIGYGTGPGFDGLYNFFAKGIPPGAAVRVLAVS